MIRTIVLLVRDENYNIVAAESKTMAAIEIKSATPGGSISAYGLEALKADYGWHPIVKKFLDDRLAKSREKRERKRERIAKRPPVRPKTIYMILTEDKTIVGVATKYHLAMKHVPEGGSVVPITPGIMRKNFGNVPVVTKFLKTYQSGIWFE